MKTYLGDGAYADFDGYSIILTTENGISIQNRIVLEPEVYLQLVRYVENLKRRREEESQHDPMVWTN